MQEKGTLLTVGALKGAHEGFGALAGVARDGDDLNAHLVQVRRQVLQRRQVVAAHLRNGDGS